MIIQHYSKNYLVCGLANCLQLNARSQILQVPQFLYQTTSLKNSVLLGQQAMAGATATFSVLVPRAQQHSVLSLLGAFSWHSFALYLEQARSQISFYSRFQASEFSCNLQHPLHWCTWRTRDAFCLSILFTHWEQWG